MFCDHNNNLTMEDLIGKQLGQYQIVAQLGKGGMAAVYKALQPSMERLVAIKILPRNYANEPDFVHRFKQEAKIIAGLEHPNIVPVYDYSETDGYTYLIMRYVDGKTLTTLLRENNLPLPKIRKIISEIASALDYAHSRGVVHRDIKPSNVLIDGQGNCLLSDFGIAKILISSPKLTNTGAFIGTPTYASPEQCLGHSNLDCRSDVYSLGVILYEMTTGQPPFHAETPMGLVVKHIHDPLPSPSKINPAIPKTIEQVILKALAKEPAERYQTAGEMAKALETAITEVDGEIKSLPPDPHTSTTVSKLTHKIPVWGWVLGIAMGLCILAGIVGMGIRAAAPLINFAQNPTTPATPENPTNDVTEIGTPTILFPTVISPTIDQITTSPTSLSENAATPAWNSSVSARMPTLDEIDENNIPTIWNDILADIPDIPSPGTEYYEVTLTSDKEYLWPLEWCSLGKALLDENIEAMSLEFLINGKAIPKESIFYYQYANDSGWNCSYWATVLGNWESGAEYNLVVSYTFNSEVFDGEESYPAGDYVHCFRTTIK